MFSLIYVIYASYFGPHKFWRFFPFCKVMKLDTKFEKGKSHWMFTGKIESIFAPKA